MQPWKAAYDKDYTWLGDVITKHYHGDDSDVKVLIGGMLARTRGWTVVSMKNDWKNVFAN